MRPGQGAEASPARIGGDVSGHNRRAEICGRAAGALITADTHPVDRHRVAGGQGGRRPVIQGGCRRVQEQDRATGTVYQFFQGQNHAGEHVLQGRARGKEL